MERKLTVEFLLLKRGRNLWWVYLCWLLLYAPMALLYVEEITFHGHVNVLYTWPFLLPVAVIVVQWVRPTFLGWVLIMVPTIAVVAAGFGLLLWATINDPEAAVRLVPMLLVVGAVGYGMLRAKPQLPA